MSEVKEALVCYHCGDSMKRVEVRFEDHNFCCDGCRTVFQILQDNQLCQYYSLDAKAGLKMDKPLSPQKYAYLDNPVLSEPLFQFKKASTGRVLFFIPEMHCASCIWLLERLHKLLPGVLESRVNFDRKELSVHFNTEELSLRKLVEQLTALGYEPALSAKRENGNSHRALLYRLGVAGFCTGNIMLFSFPEYLGMDPASEATFGKVFQYLNLILSLPVIFFAAQPFFKQAWKGLIHKHLNIDFPLALGISALFIRSVSEVIFGWGPGFFDTLSALVFFLLIGRWLQERAYDALSFDRDFRSYFPMAVEVIPDNRDEKSNYVSLDELKVGQYIRVRNGELVPADCLLVFGNAQVDYSFVNGESVVEPVSMGSLIYAGGRQVGGAIELQVARPVSESYLSALWNQQAEEEGGYRVKTFSDKVGRYFTIALVIIAAATLFYWYPSDPARAFNAFTAVLIVACPCVLVVAAPFAFGNAMRWLAKNGIYLKKPETVEKVAKVDEVVFDKTGTLTEGSAQINEIFSELNEVQRVLVAGIFKQSSHPIASIMFRYLAIVPNSVQCSFIEMPGKGIKAIIDGDRWQLGSAKWILDEEETSGQSGVCIALNGNLVARYSIQWRFRPDLDQLFEGWRIKKSLFSGDHPAGRDALLKWFKSEELHFLCSPEDKLNALKTIRLSGAHPMMVGDGLNDAGAIKEAWLGVSITENVHSFTPACDVIMVGKSIQTLPRFLRFCKNTFATVKFSFIFSLIYNTFWMSIAVQGNLMPLVAALLMPISSITVFAINTIGIRYFAGKERLI